MTSTVCLSWKRDVALTEVSPPYFPVNGFLVFFLIHIDGVRIYCVCFIDYTVPRVRFIKYCVNIVLIGNKSVCFFFLLNV